MNTEMGVVSPVSYLTTSSWLFEESSLSKWTPEENKIFENAIALFDKDTPDRWHNVASLIPGKTVEDVIKQYNELVEDVGDIEAGLIPIPGYSSNSFTLEWMTNHGCEGFKNLYSPGGKRNFSARCTDHERKKGVPWTEEEHRQFLLGLEKYGKGYWRNISRNFVTTRTPTQVASHAQKYFIRQLSGGKDKRRSSIHDITSVNLNNTKSPSPEKNRPCSPETPSSLILQTHHNLDSTNVVVRPNYSSNLKNPGSILGFSQTNKNLPMTHLQEASGYGSVLNMHGHNNLQGIDTHHRLSQLGHHGMVFQMYPH